MKLIVLTLIVFFSTSNCYGYCDSSIKIEQHDLMLAQIQSVKKLNKNKYVINFTPIEMYTTRYFKLMLLDSSKSYILDSLETEYHKKLRNNGFDKGYTSNFSKGKAKSFECFRRGYIKIRHYSIRKIKKNQILFLEINHLQSSDNELVVDFIVEPKLINISQLAIID